MEFCINAKELRKALKDIEAAEGNGFDYCLSVFKMSKVGLSISDCIADYSDMIEKAHPSNGNLDWGRFQGVTMRNKFVDGELIYIERG